MFISRTINAWEIQKDVGRLHETYKKLRMLGSRSSRRPLKTVKLEIGELTTTEAQRQQRCQEHFCCVAAGRLHLDPVFLISFPLVRDSRVYNNDYGLFSSPYSCSDEIVTITKVCGPDLLLKASGRLLMCVDECTLMHHVVCCWPIT